MQPDYDAYLPYLEDMDMTEEAKREYIDHLWLVMQSFAEIGFGVDPVSLAVKDFCEQELTQEQKKKRKKKKHPESSK